VVHRRETPEDVPALGARSGHPPSSRSPFVRGDGGDQGGVHDRYGVAWRDDGRAVRTARGASVPPKKTAHNNRSPSPRLPIAANAYVPVLLFIVGLRGARGRERSRSAETSERTAPTDRLQATRFLGHGPPPEGASRASSACSREP